MTQYPQYYMSQAYHPDADPRLPARRAGILMVVLGILMLVVGLCAGAVGAMLPTFMGEMSSEQLKPFQEMESQFGVNPQTMMFVAAVVLFIFGTLFTLMGILVRGGGLGSVITSIVLSAIAILYLLLSFVGSLFQGGNIAGSACFSVLGLTLFGLLMVWLVQAAKASSRVQMMKDLMRSQQMQFQQSAQQYGQMGYQYGYPAAPPPPPPPAPPGDPNQPPTGQ